MLDVKLLSKSYRSGDRRQTVLQGLSLQVPRATIAALIGASGSGKTTLLNLLSGIDRPDEGRVLIDEVDVHALREPELTLFRRRHIGFVFQFFNLIPTLTVGENIALPMELIGKPADQIAERVDDLLGQVGLNGMAERYPETLSGGEQQRTAIARALAHRPKLLLADEPTGNLDEDTGEQIIRLLTALAREQGVTLLIVTHSARVADAADQVMRMDHGRVAGA
ncbi:ABC transporter ATP-binding protein [Thiosocius teredinicola]|uniref:ABC transporter ATP-binding protein n=1 Tax=Thiosocius teredinicola TaxID=1973002 RepID=UPI000990EFCF